MTLVIPGPADGAGCSEFQDQGGVLWQTSGREREKAQTNHGTGDLHASIPLSATMQALDVNAPTQGPHGPDPVPAQGL